VTENSNEESREAVVVVLMRMLMRKRRFPSLRMQLLVLQRRRFQRLQILQMLVRMKLSGRPFRRLKT
ncbi:unnamed protein product, partial [Brassica oleracea var. botrytis]